LVKFICLRSMTARKRKKMLPAPKMERPGKKLSSWIIVRIKARVFPSFCRQQINDSYVIAVYKFLIFVYNVLYLIEINDRREIKIFFYKSRGKGITNTIFVKALGIWKHHHPKRERERKLCRDEVIYNNFVLTWFCPQKIM